MSGPITIPIGTPYSFDDGFVPLPESQLQTMSVADLMAYSNVVSTSAGLEYSTILGNQYIQSQYATLLQLSKSTMDGLDYEIQANDATTRAATQREKYLEDESAKYICTMAKYEEDITAQEDIIGQAESTIEGLARESSTLGSTISGANSTFTASAQRYSTLYLKYVGWKNLADDNTQLIAKREVDLSNAIIEEKSSRKKLQDTTDRWHHTSGELSTLYEKRRTIDSTLTKRRVDEAEAIKNYNSTLAAISSLSTIYEAAVINQKYALSLARQTEKVNRYISLLSTFDEADILYNESIPQYGGGADSGASRAILGDTTLWAARSMAEQRLQSAITEKNLAQDETARLQTLAGIAETDAYESILTQYESNVKSAKIKMNTLRSYKETALQSVRRFSTLYELADADVKKYSSTLTRYSSFYESSIKAASSLYGLAKEDDTVIEEAKRQSDVISHGISSLNKRYSEYISSYHGWMNVSSYWKEASDTAEESISTLSSFYTQKTTSLRRMRERVRELNGQIQNSSIHLAAQSSILKSEMINLAAYDAQLKATLNIQENAAVQYKETYCRVERMTLQNMYEGLVLGAVQAASTMTASNMALAGGNQVTATPVDLTPAPIQRSYRALTSINNFLATFANVYAVYNAQDTTITQLSTSIGYQSVSWSTLNQYSNQYYATLDPTTRSMMAAAQVDESQKQDSVNGLLERYAANQLPIQEAKQTLSTTYATFFSPSEMQIQESTISSFIITGYRQATDLLQQQGITITF